MYVIIKRVLFFFNLSHILTRVFTRAQLALISKGQDRDTQHQELTKVKLQQEETQNDLEQQREILHKLTQQINSMEQSLKRVN